MNGLPFPFSNSVIDFHLISANGYEEWCMECDFALSQSTRIPDELLEGSPHVSKTHCKFVDGNGGKTVTKCMYIKPRANDISTKMLMRIRHLDKNGLIICDDAHCKEGSTKVVINYYNSTRLIAPRYGVKGEGGFYGFTVYNAEGHHHKIHSFVVSEQSKKIHGNAFEYNCINYISSVPMEAFSFFNYNNGTEKEWSFIGEEDKVAELKKRFLTEKDQKLCPL